jgi:hypothetical protein
VGNPVLGFGQVDEDRVVGAVQPAKAGLEIPVSGPPVVKPGQADKHCDELIVIEDEAALTVTETGGHMHRVAR